VYDRRLPIGGPATAGRVLRACGALVACWAAAYFVLPPWTLVRHVPVFFAAGAAVAVPAWRQLAASWLARPALRRRIVIVGAGRAGRGLLAALRAEAPHDLDVVGFVDDAPGLVGSSVDGVPVLADRTGLLEAARSAGATEVVLAITHGVPGELLEALLRAREHGLAIVPMPLLYEWATGRVPVEHVGDHWEVALPLDPPVARAALYPLLRRAGDVAFAAAALVALAALLPVVGPLIRAASPGPVFYRQRRVGRGGRPFVLYKLRTMVDDAEPGGPVWARPGDPRITPIGRVLRRSRLDELPQALNVLRGEMSLIGPRPERPELVDRLAAVLPFYRARHAVRPGLTGWAAVHAGYAASEADALVKLQYDLYYIKHQSLLLDARILWRTVALVLRLSGR
jgi:exopolysaccharide biosynthesis polyprenyl glycosylphosphotransferase